MAASASCCSKAPCGFQFHIVLFSNCPGGVSQSVCLSAGMLVVNVTWRNKTYVGTLLDCTRHDWAPPRYTPHPLSDQSVSSSAVCLLTLFRRLSVCSGSVNRPPATWKCGAVAVGGSGCVPAATRH